MDIRIELFYRRHRYQYLSKNLLTLRNTIAIVLLRVCQMFAFDSLRVDRIQNRQQLRATFH